MSEYAANPYASTVAAHASANVRGRFIRRTYNHLAGAILAFVILEYVLLHSPMVGLIPMMVGGFGWLVVLAMFMVTSWIAERWAASSTSRGMQYMGLGLFIVAEAIIFMPLLFVAANFGGKDVIPAAGILTLVLFAGLTAIAFVSGKDYSFLKGFLTLGFFVAIGVIVASILIGFSLGVFFSAFMIIFAGGAILYETSNIIRHYHTDQHVAASLALFASVALLFWYVLQLLMSFGRD